MPKNKNRTKRVRQTGSSGKRRKQTARSERRGRETRSDLSWQKKLLFGGSAYLMFFAAGELGLAAIGVAPLIEREDPSRGFSGLVHVYEREADRYRTAPANTLHTFNDQSFLAEKPANGFRIFGLGGSSAFGFPWGAEAAFPAIVGEALAEVHPERTIEAVNAAGTSYAMHRVSLVADELLGYEPDVFVIYSGHNEFIEPAFFTELEERNAARERLDYALAHSRLYTLLLSLSERLGSAPREPSFSVGMDVARDESRRFSEGEKAEVSAAFRRRLQLLVQRARDAGVAVVLCTVPANLSEWRPEASASGTALRGPNQAEWASAVEAGDRELREGRFVRAARYLERAVALVPEHAATQFALGQALEGAGRFEEAAAAYEAAADRDASPIRRTSAINRAIREVAAEERVPLVDVDALFRQRSANGLVGLEWIEDYVHPTRAGHELIAWHVARAIEASGAVEAPPALDRGAFEEVVARRRSRPLERNATWFYNTAVLLSEQGRVREAIDKYREALVILPTYEAALLNLGYLLGEVGASAESVEVLERLLALNPKLTGPGAHVNLGNSLQRLGRFGEAARHYRQALELQPDTAFIHTNLGNALLQMDQLEEALAQYQRAHQLWPEDAVNHNAWGEALARAGRSAEAAARYRQAIALDPKLVAARRNLARMSEGKKVGAP